ncbi:tetratricopeptide repeat protein 9C-like [Mizuhopecten yessoensis]|uniref:Tetratricopeptide repeat protein 9C n=1 Tax=Mizuhopecten yessoensis TaxID=6573 RepID=A0A210QNT1_MIZYE|nr:tetratricopeptide repeat protein 9C-like [Mizuhopecten yessoensis]OWF50396.1 Tetratricopeptide repeat protein 9C [Mizuhopecten yessoensis]
MQGASVKISDEEKIRTAATFKADGNAFYKEKDIRKAIGKYHRAILQLKAVGSEKKCAALMPVPVALSSQELSDDMKDLFTSLRVDCYNNLAACLLHQEATNYRKVLEYCDQVLEDQPSNSKARHRKGVALYHLKQYDEAQAILLSLNGTDAATKKYLALCKQAIREEDKQLQKTYRAMFSSNSTQPTQMEET